MNADHLLQKVRSIALDLPESKLQQEGGHAAFLVRDRKFGWFLNNHHNDGMVCLCVKIDPEEKENLIEFNPEKYLRPAYVSRFGWMSIRLDAGRVDWDELERRIRASYRTVAPRTLSVRIE